MKRKILIWIALVFITPLISGIYGIVHDQITYSLSPEYYTRFKFIQFHMDEFLIESERMAVVIVGFMSTWWVGFLIALILGGLGIRKIPLVKYFKIKLNSILIIFLTTIIVGFLGWIIGEISLFFISEMPYNIGGRVGEEDLEKAMAQIEDWQSFFVVGMIHNFSYFGALVGFVIALVYHRKIIKDDQY